MVISDEIDELFELPALYRTAREALELMMDRRFHSASAERIGGAKRPDRKRNPGACRTR